MIPVSTFGVNLQSRSIGIKLEEERYWKIQKKRHNQDTIGHLILKKFFLRWL